MPARKPYAKVSVIVPTYRRTADLARCLAALDAQERRADEVIVIVRHDDHASLDWLRTREANRPDPHRWVVLLHQPGVVAAYNLGIDSASGDVLCFTDDDATPHTDWIARIVRAFECDPALGGLGGCDIVHERDGALQIPEPCVDLVRWYGRAVGHHAADHGQAREVQMLTGVSMSFRREAIGTLRFDTRLRGADAPVHCEMAFSLDVQRRGWKLIYDPALWVERIPTRRNDGDQQAIFSDTAFYNASFNRRLIMCEHLSPPGRWAFVVYATLIGDREDPGFLRALSLAFGRGGVALALRKWRVGLRAMRGAWQEAMR